MLDKESEAMNILLRPGSRSDKSRSTNVATDAFTA